MTWNQTCGLIRSDVQRRIAYDGRLPSFGNSVRAFFSPPNLALTIHRLQTFAEANRIPLVSKLLSIVNLVCFSAELAAGAKIGEGCLLVSPNGIGLHARTTIGKNCTLVHQITITLGPRVGMDEANDQIIIGDNVTLSAGVRVIGNLSIGDNCWIGPNKVIMDSVPAGTILS
jgi:serine O-acetyltransferase